MKTAVLCLTYNHEEFIADAINSFLSQETSEDFSIIIHDDASTDDTLKIVNSYKKMHPYKINVVSQKENVYRMSRSEQILKFKPLYSILDNYDCLAYCEGDDYWISEKKLEKQVSFLKENKDFFSTIHSYATRRGDNIIYPDASHDICLSASDVRRNKVFARRCTLVQRNIRRYQSYLNSPGKNDIIESKYIKNGDLFTNSISGYFGKSMYFGSFVGSVFRANEESTWEYLPEAEKAQHRAVSGYWIAKFHERMGDLDAAEYWANYALRKMHAGLQGIFEKKAQQTNSDRILFDTVDQIRLDVVAGNYRHAQRQLKLALKKYPSNCELLKLQVWIENLAKDG